MIVCWMHARQGWSKGILQSHTVWQASCKHKRALSRVHGTVIPMCFALDMSFVVKSDWNEACACEHRPAISCCMRNLLRRCFDVPHQAKVTHLAICQNLVVSLSSIEAQLYQLLLKGDVHVHRICLLPFCLHVAQCTVNSDLEIDFLRTCTMSILCSGIIVLHAIHCCIQNTTMSGYNLHRCSFVAGFAQATLHRRAQ